MSFYTETHPDRSKTREVTIRVSRETYRWLEQQRDRLGVSIARVGREVIEQAAATRTKQHEQ